VHLEFIRAFLFPDGIYAITMNKGGRTYEKLFRFNQSAFGGFIDDYRQS
jgi:hypothetical protein